MLQAAAQEAASCYAKKWWVKVDLTYIRSCRLLCKKSQVTLRNKLKVTQIVAGARSCTQIRLCSRAELVLRNCSSFEKELLEHEQIEAPRKTGVQGTVTLIVT